MLRLWLAVSLVAVACGKRPAQESTSEDASVVAATAPVPAPVPVPPAMGDPPKTIVPSATASVAPPEEIPEAPAAKTLPAGFADMPNAARLEIQDEWNGLGPTHALVAILERAPGGRTFTVTAKVTTDPGALKANGAEDCLIRDENGKCDVRVPGPGPKVTTKRVTMDATPIEAFLAEVAGRKIDAKQDHDTRDLWSDDYPIAKVIVWVPGVKAPIHLAFKNQLRHWRVNGAFLTVDPDYRPPKEVPIGFTVHKRINDRYYRALRDMGLESWSKEINRGRGSRRP